MSVIPYEINANSLNPHVAQLSRTIEALTEDRDSWRRVAQRLETEKQAALSPQDAVATNYPSEELELEWYAQWQKMDKYPKFSLQEYSHYAIRKACDWSTWSVQAPPSTAQEGTKEILQTILKCLTEFNESNLLCDTIWLSDGETLLDYIENSIERFSSQPTAQRIEPVGFASPFELKQMECGSVAWGTIFANPNPHRDNVAVYTSPPLEDGMAKDAARWNFVSKYFFIGDIGGIEDGETCLGLLSRSMALEDIVTSALNANSKGKSHQDMLNLNDAIDAAIEAVRRSE